MQKGSRFSVAIGLVLALSACSEDSPPPEAVQVSVPEPKDQIMLNVADFPSVDYGYFARTLSTGERSIFQLQYASNSLTPLNSSTNAQFYRPRINLGEGRTTSAWAFMEDGGKLYRLDPVKETATQISTFNAQVCKDGLRSYQTDVGLSATFLVLHSPGNDSTCDTADDVYTRVTADAQPTDAPATASAHQFTGTALNRADGSLAGFAVPSDTALTFYNAAGQATASLSGTSDRLRVFRRGDGHFWVFFDRTLYDVPETTITDNSTTATQVTTLTTAPSALNQSGEMLFILSGTTLIQVDETDNTVTSLADLSSDMDTPTHIAQISDAFVYLFGTHSGKNRLLAVGRNTGVGTTIIAAENARGDAVALDGRLFYNTHDGTDFTAHIWEESTMSSSSSRYQARWVGVNLLTEEGAEKRVLLHAYENPDNALPTRQLLWLDAVSADFSQSDLTPYTYAHYGSTLKDSEVIQVDTANKNRLLLTVESTTAATVQEVYQVNLSAAQSLKNTRVSVTPGQGSLDF